MVPRLQRPRDLGRPLRVGHTTGVPQQEAKPRLPRKPKPSQPRKAAATPRAASVTPRALLGPLLKAHPDWGPTLDFTTPFELLIATILAAQARDERINQVTATLFKKYRGPAAFVKAPLARLETDLRATGFYRQKARAVKATSQGLLEEFGGEVPADMESLVRLKGVGRKTASMVLANAFGVPAIAVDRHVQRVALRLGLTRHPDPDDIEADLRTYFPKKDWIKANWLLVLHGRRTCTPAPHCPDCPLLALCPYPTKAR